MVSHRIFLTVVFCSLWVLPGCGKSDQSKAVSVAKGVVTLNGVALTEGTVNFNSPSTGNGAIAQLGPEGKFTIAGGIVPGEYKVTITPPTPTPENPTPKASDIPEKYRTEATTDLTATIKGTSSDLKFELKP
jgi:hypothetical protein